jgi:NDP-sugar pyrophosphorylase family protein
MVLFIMEIILLATSQSKSCYPLTVNKPDALLRVFNRSLLEAAVRSFHEHYNDVSVVILRDHKTLFMQSAFTPKIKFHTIDDVSEAGKFASESAVLVNVRNYFPGSLAAAHLASGFFRIEYAWDLLSCHERFHDIIEPANEGHVEPNATLKGKIQIGKGTIVRSGTYIDGNIVIGENCIIGPNCYIRGICSIGSNCRIGNAVEIKSSILGDNVNVCHLSYLGDSIIGDGANLGAGFISSNLRHDEKPVVTRLNGERINTGRQKLGVIIGDGVHTGAGTIAYPGRKIWPGVNTLPGSIIERDMEGYQ